VNALGYNHPAVNAAIMQQVDRYIHVSNIFYQDAQVELAELMLRASRMARIFFTNSGTEAMEAAIKVCRKWGKPRDKVDIFGLTDSFHGRSLGALSITGREKYREGFEPFLPNTHLLKFNDVAQLEHAVNGKTLAVVLEFIQGEGGINLVSPEYVERLNQLRSHFGFLVIADEIQSGMGRTGKMFAFEHFGFTPDIIVVAKAIGGGLPLGALMGNEQVSEVFTPGTHGTTFGGNPVACAAGLATVREILEHGVMNNAAEMGNHLMQRLEELHAKFPDNIAEVRGRGLMVGLELKFDGTDLVDHLVDRGVLLNVTNSRVLRWLPPLNIRQEQLDAGVEAVKSAIGEMSNVQSTKAFVPATASS
jgi:predicted acetylornithine/succinylornithine family transaminase